MWTETTFIMLGAEHVAARRASSSENASPIVSTGTETIGEWTRLHSSNLELAMSHSGHQRRFGRVLPTSAVHPTADIVLRRTK